MAYTVIQLKNSERKDYLLYLWQRNFGPINGERYDWIYESNPQGPATCFFLKYDKADAIVGAISLFPRILNIRGQSLSGYICGDFVVEKGHRSIGPALKLLKAVIYKCEEEDPCILIGFPNRSSSPVMQRAGFEVLGSRFEMTQILNSYPYLRNRMSAMPVVARALSLPLNAMFHMQNGDFPLHEKRGSNDSFENLYNEEFDRSFSFSKRAYSLIGQRDLQYLRWRFLENPNTQHYLFTLGSNNKNRSSNYIIYRMKDKRARISDIFIEGKDKFPSLLNAFARYQRLQGTDSVSISFSGDDHFFELIRKSGYSLRSRDEKVLIYTSGRNALVNDIRKGPWFLDSADNDTDV